jgi:hypothetical protein
MSQESVEIVRRWNAAGLQAVGLEPSLGDS